MACGAFLFWALAGVFMAEASVTHQATASNVESLVLRKLAGVKNATVAHAIRHDEGHVSRIASGERGLRLAELGPFMAALGLRVIECDGAVESMPAEEAAALRTLARKALA